MQTNSVPVTFKGNALTHLGAETKVGQKAPDFTLLNNKLQPVKLSDFAGKVKIISVFPSIDTGICAAQTRRFNQEAANLSEDVVVLSVSADLPFALGRFCGAEGIERNLTLSDHLEMEFGQKYGFWIQEMRLLSRGVVVVDRDDVVRYVEYVTEIASEPQFEAPLAVARELV